MASKKPVKRAGKRRNRLPSGSRQERADKLFEAYWELGDNRSLARLAETADVSFTTIRNYSKDYGWQERLIERAEAIARKQDEVVVELAAKFRRQQVQYLIRRLAQFQVDTQKLKLDSSRLYIELSELLQKVLKRDEEQKETKVVVLNSVPGE